MCFNIPGKVLKKEEKEVIVLWKKRKRKVFSLINVKEGDYVLLSGNFIIKKISKRDLKKFIDLTR
ncbi:MAG: HypC/HybG/HupF family hydrogenase formation chaperone [Candidatus Pacearchaeota archaeon]